MTLGPLPLSMIVASSRVRVRSTRRDHETAARFAVECLTEVVGQGFAAVERFR